MAEEPTSFTAQPKAWRGVRDSEPAHKILDEEWVNSSNVDSRTGRRRDGLTVKQTLESVSVIGVAPYRYPDGTLHVLAYNSSGKVFSDGSQVLSGLSGANHPVISQGNGTVFIANGVNPVYWRDPADNVWKTLQNFPSGWVPKIVNYHPLNKRLYVAPTVAGVDYYAWSNADFTGATIAFTSPGGGAEYIGGNREPITGMHHGLGDDFCIFTTDHLYQLRGLDPSDWRVRFVSGDVGCSAARSVVLIGHGLFFAHTSGCYLVNALGAVTFPPLTAPKQRAWDAMVKTYEAYLQYAHAHWNAQQHTVYLFVPTASSNKMGQLWKFYLPDGSVTTHDVTGYSSAYLPPRYSIIGREDGKVVALNDGEDDLGTAFTGWIRSKIYGDPARVFNWGVQQKMVMLFKPNATGTVRVKPIIYAQHERGVIEGTLQTIDLNQTGDEIRATIYLPEAQGWGIQFYIEGESAWEWQGFHVEARRGDLE